MLPLQPHVWPETLVRLRTCGAARLECVVYWLASQEEPSNIIEVVHPRHLATAHSYEVESEWLHQIWHDLVQRRRRIVAQVHTHGGAAFHSDTDDKWPIICTSGFISIVLPNFGFEFTRADVFITTLDERGRWRRTNGDSVGGLP